MANLGGDDHWVVSAPTLLAPSLRDVAATSKGTSVVFMGVESLPTILFGHFGQFLWHFWGRLATLEGF